jgi:hypothetical protein
MGDQMIPKGYRNKNGMPEVKEPGERTITTSRSPPWIFNLPYDADLGERELGW